MSRRDAVIPGWNATLAAFAAGRSISTVYLQAGRDDERARRVRELADEQGIAVHDADAARLEELAPGIRHQGCVTVGEAARVLDETALEILCERLSSPLVLVLDQVQDPHNLGACLRTAAAAGAAAVVAPKARSAGLTPAARKVSAGGAELVPFVQVTNLARCLRGLQARGLWAVGTSADADRSLHEVDLGGSLALVLGGEGAGLRRLTAESCDMLAAIPMAPGVESLNVSVAAGVCLFEARRQRGA